MYNWFPKLIYVKKFVITYSSITYHTASVFGGYACYDLLNLILHLSIVSELTVKNCREILYRVIAGGQLRDHPCEFP